MKSLIRFFIVSSGVMCLTVSQGYGRAMMSPHPGTASNDLVPLPSDSEAAIIFIEPVQTYWDLHTSHIAATFDNSGHFGAGFVDYPICDGELCPSFQIPEESDIEYLFAGTLWVGGIVDGDTLVTVGFDGWFNGVMEFNGFVPGYDFKSVGDRSVWTLFSDTAAQPYVTGIDPIDNRPHIPMNLRVANRANVWTSYPGNNVIIYDMVITNIGDSPIEDGYIGYYFDGDVYHESNIYGGITDDLTGSLPDQGIGYIIDNDGDPTGGAFDYRSPTACFAFKFLGSSSVLSDTGYNWWVSNGNPLYDFGPQEMDEYGNLQCNFGEHIGTPTGDRNKYCLLSHSGWDYDQIYTADSVPGWTCPAPPLANNLADGIDTRFLMSLGPFDLAPDSSLRILYTTFTGDSIHRVADNLTNLPGDPDQYLANLDFSRVIANAAVADSLVPYLIDPDNPVVGLHAQFNGFDSVAVEWDPWGFSEVEGYEIYLYEIPFDSIPYPGVTPPWIRPTELDHIASVGQIYRYTLTGLIPYNVYLISMANRTAKEIGRMSDPLAVRPGGLPPAPLVDNEYAFIRAGRPAVVSWSEPDGTDVDYYNVYKFADSGAAKEKYYPFYDADRSLHAINPRDSFFVDGRWYYYYAMEPYNQTDSGVTGFMHYAEDSVVYVVTAVSKTGLESAFSADVIILEAPPQTKDIVVVTGMRVNSDWVATDSVTAFYDSILQGYDYDLYMFRDTINAYYDYPDVRMKPDWWLDLMSFRLVILDGELRYEPLASDFYFENLTTYIKYMWSGGLLAYFGSLSNFGTQTYRAHPAYYPVFDKRINRYFGIDSVFKMSLFHYHDHASSPYVDSLTGLIYAEPVDPAMPLINYDAARNPYSPIVHYNWPASTAPVPSTFVINENATVTHVFRSLHPETSMIEGDPVGIKAQTQGTTMYAFGFHLWYMLHDDGRALVDYLMSQTGTYATGSTTMAPDSLDFLSAYALTPQAALVYLGNLSGEYSVAQIDPATVRINGVVEPTAVAIVDSYAGYDGPVMSATVNLRDFILGYSPLWGIRSYPYRVSASLFDGTQVSAFGNVVISGFLAGDVNADNSVNLGDALYLLDYLFRSGPPPAWLPAGDVNGDGTVDISDVVYLVNYIFRGGPPPVGGS